MVSLSRSPPKRTTKPTTTVSTYFLIAAIIFRLANETYEIFQQISESPEQVLQLKGDHTSLYSVIKPYMEFLETKAAGGEFGGSPSSLPGVMLGNQIIPLRGCVKIFKNFQAVPKAIQLEMGGFACKTAIGAWKFVSCRTFMAGHVLMLQTP